MSVVLHSQFSNGKSIKQLILLKSNIILFQVIHVKYTTIKYCVLRTDVLCMS